MPRARIHLSLAEATAKGWRCKSHLKADRLMPAPGAKPAGTVWQGRGAYNVYSPDNCIPYRWQPGPAQQWRQSVSARAREWLESGLVLDLETTGLQKDDEVCEITILDAIGTPLLNTLVRPTRPIPEDATAIHHITDAMVADAPSWPEVAPIYENIITGRTVITYNAAFDRRLLAQTYQRYGLTPPRLVTRCAMELYAEWNTEWDARHDSFVWQKLIVAATECSAVVEGAHRSLPDAQMTLGVLQYLQRRKNGRRLPRPKPITPCTSA